MTPAVSNVLTIFPTGQPDAEAGTFTFPQRWMTADWVHCELVLSAKIERGEAFIGGGVLADDTNLFCLSYPGGRRCARATRANEWAIEEHFEDATDLSSSDKAFLAEGWRHVVDGMVGTRKWARERGL